MMSPPLIALLSPFISLGDLGVLLRFANIHTGDLSVQDDQMFRRVFFPSSLQFPSSPFCLMHIWASSHFQAFLTCPISIFRDVLYPPPGLSAPNRPKCFSPKSFRRADGFLWPP